MVLMITAGDDAPAFTAQDQDGNLVSLSDFTGQRVVLYFYPKDDTPGCTKEACTLRDNIDRFAEKDVVVLGVSADTVASHAAFAETYNLLFTLLADPDREIIRAYGVETGDGYAKRATFIIGPDQTVETVHTDVDPANHADQLLEEL